MKGGKQMIDCSLNDTTTLRNLIIQNPDLPLVIFTGDEAWTGEYSYEYAPVRSVSIKELTLYDNCWLDRDDYAETLVNDLSNDEEYKALSDEEFEQMICDKVKETEFVKAIVIYVG